MSKNKCLKIPQFSASFGSPSDASAIPVPELILASSSIHRKRLLQRLGLVFRCVAPDIDETAHAGETAHELVLRLGREKARSVAARHPGAVVIASDQVGCNGSQILGKPGTLEHAREQLLSMSSCEIRFLTALCVHDARTSREFSSVESCTVRMRRLDERMVDGYLRREQPLDCAGSFKVEGLGIALFESIRLDDPTALEGLPLIRLVEFLDRVGLSVL